MIYKLIQKLTIYEMGYVDRQKLDLNLFILNSNMWKVC